MPPDVLASSFLAGSDRRGGPSSDSAVDGASQAGKAQPCTIIVPVYGALDEAVECLESVARWTDANCRILAIDDATPGETLADRLPEPLRADRRLEVVRNARNLGFVGTCNLGIRRAAPCDVVLLNSDTRVARGWLDGLRRAAYSHPAIGTVTPWSNNGDICSLPRRAGAPRLPDGFALDEMAELVSAVSLRAYPDLPTCVGFCVYVKREVFDRVGLLDEARFGRGYGEENDFALRAEASGFRNVLDDATFVYHRGGASFAEQAHPRRTENYAALLRRHRGFGRRVRRFAARDPLAPLRRRVHDALLARWIERRGRIVLHLLHNSPIMIDSRRPPGGVERHVADLCQAVEEAAHWSLYVANGAYHLTAHLGGAPRRWSFSARRLPLERLLEPALVDVIHVHQIEKVDEAALADALRRHGRYVVSLHDFRLCCPRTHLLDRAGRLCAGVDCRRRCGCAASEIEALRRRSAELLAGARAVFYFSDSTRALVGEMLGHDARWVRIDHALPGAAAAAKTSRSPGASRDETSWGRYAVGTLEKGLAAASAEHGSVPARDEPAPPSRPLRVAFLGQIGPHKGADLVRQVVRLRALPGGAPVEWHLIGTIRGGIGRNVTVHGRYERDELPSLIERIRPDVVALLSTWPETYNYTLDEAVRCGVPVVSTPLGAPAERVARLGCGWVLERLDAASFFATLERIAADWPEYLRVRDGLRGLRWPTLPSVAARYAAAYAEACAGAVAPRSAEAAARWLDRLDRWAAEFAVSPGVARTVGRAVVNAGVSALECVGLRGVAERVALRLLPVSWRAKINDLRVSRAWAEP